MGQHKKDESAMTPEEVVCAALNEQGYLLHHKLVKVLQPSAGHENFKHEWYVEASEVPVSLPNGDETRVDIVLRHRQSQPENPWHLAVECKRAARDYKRWVFFSDIQYGQGPSPFNYYTEHARLRNGWNHQGDPDLSHYLLATAATNDCPAFDFGIEVRTEPPSRDKRASATTAIEDSLHQVTLGQTGLANTLRRAHMLFFHLIPVVVTTAELMSAHFDASKISLNDGKIAPQDLKLEPRKWLAVNFRISDVVSQLSGLDYNRNKSIAQHIASRQVRTVFIVQAQHLQSFLVWLEKLFPCGPTR
jgi:hypothetical protein